MLSQEDTLESAFGQFIGKRIVKYENAKGSKDAFDLVETLEASIPEYFNRYAVANKIILEQSSEERATFKEAVRKHVNHFLTEKGMSASLMDLHRTSITDALDIVDENFPPAQPKQEILSPKKVLPPPSMPRIDEEPDTKKKGKPNF